MPAISITREELLERLLAAKVRAEKEDAVVADKHHREEEAILSKFRDRLRDALKWDWKTLKKNGFEVELPYGRRPSCPELIAPRIDRAIKQVRMDSRKERFNLGTDHEWIAAALWEPRSGNKQTVCD